MQAAETVFRFAGALIIWAFIGFVIAAAIKAFQRRDKLPQWPIAVFVVIGLAVSFARQSSAGLL
jgi:hypothetical protein